MYVDLCIMRSGLSVVATCDGAGLITITVGAEEALPVVDSLAPRPGRLVEDMAGRWWIIYIDNDDEVVRYYSDNRGEDWTLLSVP
jgi:hypothetical protein